jgi:hypothetical protein
MLFIIIGVVLALIMLFLAFRSARHKRLIDDTPTSRTQGVFIGMAELKGTAESEKPLAAYLSGLKCVYFRWQVEEEWSRTVHETYRDSQGHTQNRTRTESGWKTVAQNTVSVPFYLKDDTGVIRIDPHGAEITDLQTFYRSATPGDELYYSKGPLTEVDNSIHRRRFRENAILVHAQLYVLGHARERQDTVAAEISQDKGSPFIISTKSEKQIRSNYALQYWLFLIGGLVITMGFAAGWHIFTHAAIPIWQSIVFSGFIYLAAGGIGWLWMVYNSLVSLRQRVTQAWSQVDVQIKRRHDFIPNLVKVVEGYRNYEKETQQTVTELRAQFEATPPGVAGMDYHGLLPVLRTVVENYPELKSSEQYLLLQKSLVETEQRIALARDYYNSIATFYNTRLQIIPDRFVAYLTGFNPKLLFCAADFERAVVKVSLE